MKIHKIILPVAAASMLLAGCDDSIMEWGTPEGHHPVTSADIPLAVKEVIANYDDIKTYADQYTPNLIVGLGFGADMYINNTAYKELADANFQMFTAGNAMKMDAMLTSAGAFNFATVDNMLEAMPEGMKLYGHNFIWHTQQRQAYLKSVIAPTLVVESDSDIKTILGGDAADFNGGTTGGWGSWGGNNPTSAISAEGEGYNSNYCLVLTNPEDGGAGNAWKAQCAYTFDLPLQKDKKYILQFYAKSSAASGVIQFQYQNSTTYGSQGGYHSFNIGTDWALYEYEFVMPNDDDDRILLNFGEVGATYYVDDIKFGLAKNQDEAAGAKIYKFAKNSKGARKAGMHKAKSYYVLKTAEEKRDVLLNAMDMWIKGVSDHLKEKNVTPYGYDVINEPIADGANTPRGFNNVFNGEDTAPVETEDEGLELNWKDNDFYWGYYVPDYAVQAFTKARAYLPKETKLFINDYNLETSSKKREAFIQFAKDIDKAYGSAVVDGLGTQMHLTLNVADDDDLDTQIENFMALVDASLTDLAATGKLVRITELDISIGKNVNDKQLEAQAKAYQRVFESYKRIVPEAQQSGITIWTLSDNPDEHTYWLPDQNPNLWDAQYKRKWAYKGVCDGIAGEDLGLKFGGDDYKAYYEKNNVSSAFK